MFVLLRGCYDFESDVIGIYITRQDADAEKERMEAKNRMSNNDYWYRLFEQEVGVSSISESNKCTNKCIYYKELHDSYLLAKLKCAKEYHEKEKVRQKEAKVKCDELFLNYSTAIEIEELSGLRRQYDICCNHIDIDVNDAYNSYPPIKMVDNWKEIGCAGKHLSEDDIATLTSFFQLFGIHLSFGFSKGVK